MPPFLSTKRARDEASDQSPAHATPSKRGRVAAAPKPAVPNKSTQKARQTPSGSLDTSSSAVQTVAHRPRPPSSQSEDDANDSSDEESDEDSDDFEDVPQVVAAHTLLAAAQAGPQAEDEESESEDSDEIEFEDVHHSSQRNHQGRHGHRHQLDTSDLDTPIGDISIDLPTLGTAPADDSGLAFSDARGVVGKKGPSKIERQIRQNTHCMHVQFLMFHNTIRNAWCQDQAVQEALVKQLPPALQKEVTRWKKALGGTKKRPADLSNPPVRPSKKNGKGKGKMVSTSKDDEDEDRALLDLIPTRNEYDDRKLRDRMRDWGAEAEPLEKDEPDLSYGDPTVRLLRFLASYWRKRFVITAPSLHKRGYLGLNDLEAEVKAWAQEPGDAERFGECIKNRQDFRQAAKRCEGSRDVGAQLFTSLLRGVGLEARLVVSLQPAGFGFGKVEDGKPFKKKAATAKSKEKDHAAFTPSALKRGIDMKKNTRQLQQPSKSSDTRNRNAGRGATNTAPISLDTSSSDELSDAPSDLSDGASVVDVTPSRKSTQVYDAPPMPTYWTEVLSPLTQSYIPVVCLPQPVIANSSELLASFTPSGKAVEKAKQVLAYVVAYNSDGTAKDVTVRYLKKKQWPGKTRGVRIQKEKLPIYNKRGKVKKWIEWDWFHEVMSGYTKDPRLRSPAEKKEDEFDLLPLAPSKKDEGAADGKGNVGGKPESLQAYKNSAEYVLERHLRREEAILQDAKPVRHFKTGKGEDAKTEPVYRRTDVVTGLTVESWHKQGRAVREGEQPIKMVPIRAVTLIRKREVEDAQRETGEKPMQGLYSKDQTDWIIPDPIGPERKIPKNAFGNIDVYVPSMVPAGAVHVRLKGTAKLCKKLDIDFAEAVTGFEFGKQRAVPVITGVVVAEEHEGVIRDAWRAEQQRVKERERIKKQAACLAMWKKFLNSLKVLERMQGEYGHIEKAEEDEVNPWMNKQAREQARKRRKRDERADISSTMDAMPAQEDHGEDSYEDDALLDPDESGGGFIPEGMEVEEVKDKRDAKGHLGDDDDEGGGGFLLDEDTASGVNREKRHTNGLQHQSRPSSQLAHTATVESNVDSASSSVSAESEIETPEAAQLRSKRSRGPKGATNNTSRLSKRVAAARAFEDAAVDADAKAQSQDDSSNSSSSAEPEAVESPPPKQRKAGRNTKATTARKNGTRATPKRRAATNVRSRYFESDATGTD